ncbi:hypothetical protein ABZ234_16125 [Nocardiopsis sp. NPDC006198]|uniref:hypothetical protein n=2 Tax=Nocardiopsis TaxID=2013 RepID=UPI0033BF2C3F
MDTNALGRACSGIAVVVALTACGPGVDSDTSEEEAAMTHDEAYTRVEEHIAAAVAVFPEAPELEALGGDIANPCDDTVDGGESGRASVGRTYWLRGLPAEDNEASVELLHEYWTANGYQVTDDGRPEDLAVFVENEEDSFRMSVQSSAQGSLSIGASSPCVWPEGAPGS